MYNAGKVEALANSKTKQTRSSEPQQAKTNSGTSGQMSPTKKGLLKFSILFFLFQLSSFSSKPEKVQFHSCCHSHTRRCTIKPRMRTTTVLTLSPDHQRWEKKTTRYQKKKKERQLSFTLPGSIDKWVTAFKPRWCQITAHQLRLYRVHRATAIVPQNQDKRQRLDKFVTTKLETN